MSYRDDRDLIMKYVVVKLDDLKRYLTEVERDHFWSLFWRMIDRKEKDGSP